MTSTNYDTKVLLGITDNLPPDVKAMLMAQYSRSNESIETRMAESNPDSLRKSLFTYYSNYGHKSVGQLGSTTIYIENVSMLAAKAIENNKLFNGQEVSSRYIDFSKVDFYTPNNNKIIKKYQEKFRSIYVDILNNTINFIKEKYPFDQQHKEKNPLEKNLKIYDNTIKARAFDICRGILPAGIKTSLCYYGTFDNINDHFGELLYHPLDEVKQIANNVLDQLNQKYNAAHIPIEKIIKNNSYLTKEHFYSHYSFSDITTSKLNFSEMIFLDNKLDLRKLLDLLSNREIYNKLPNYISNNILMNCYGILDYGSYRDIHRHRNGNITFPILTTHFGFNKFYLDELDDFSRSYLIEELIKFDYEISKEYLISEEDLQYCIPIGYNVPFNYKCDLNQFLYLSTLRSNKTVHQTLRKLIQQWNVFDKTNNNILDNIYELISKHVDFDIDNFTLKRGSQTFNI